MIWFQFSIIYYIHEYNDNFKEEQYMNQFYIQKLINNLKNLEMEKEKLDQLIKEHQNELKNYMTLFNLEELTGNNGEKVIYAEVISKRFNTKEFKKQFESLYNSYLKNTKNYRFKFTYQVSDYDEISC